MGSQIKSTADASIHRIREFELEKVNLIEEFDILQIVGEGWFGKILLVEHKATDREMVLKALPKPYTALIDFYREFHYGLHLGVHKNIISAYDVAFETAGFYVFSQEYAPLGDLTSNVSENGIGELHTKRVARQLASALEYIHKKELVHRDIKLDNILVFKSDFSRIKLCDFGETRPTGSVVIRRNEWLPYAAPDILEVPTDESYICNSSHDVWQFGIVIFVCLTGCLPWQKAAFDDPRYVRYSSWHTSPIAIMRTPKLFKLVSSKAQRFFKKYLDPKEERRPNDLRDVYRYLEDRWMSKGMEKITETTVEEEGLCPSMYSFHSSPQEKDKLLHSLTHYGLETTVDRIAKKDRIRKWIENSVIAEEGMEDGGIDEPETVPKRDGAINRTEVIKNIGAERQRNRKQSSRRIAEKEYRPPVDPRIPLESQKQQISPHETSKELSNTSVTGENYIDKRRYFQNERNVAQKKIPSFRTNILLKGVGVNGSSNKKILSALPFKNVTIVDPNSPTTSSDSAISSDSSTVKYNFNKNSPSERQLSEASGHIQNRLKFM
ncbi:serine/threonine-protein kinase SBK1 [Anthonomus grandis grandis]|uniref:serine/threonine-protein kinase SBK1 n=1 Tax=Anthonomus grandis grandis TaxID=2921223 RepID=UPI002166A4B4|nr:serine/threonine-protein kinase SBK1 [Anthonomus grandis grandis]